jgi:hypothetical protein
VPDAVFVDWQGVVHLFDPGLKAIIRWDSQSRHYLPSIGLGKMTSRVSYSATLERIFTADDIGNIKRIAIGKKGYVERPLTTVSSGVGEMLAAGNFLFVTDALTTPSRRGSLFDRDGTRLGWRTLMTGERGYTWNETLGSFHYLAESQESLVLATLRLQLREGSSSKPYRTGAPLNAPATLGTPKTLDDGAWIFLPRLGILDAETLKPNLWAFDIFSAVDAVSEDGHFYVLVATSSDALTTRSKVSRHSLSWSAEIRGRPMGIFRLPGGRLLVVTIGTREGPFFTILDRSLQVDQTEGISATLFWAYVESGRIRLLTELTSNEFLCQFQFKKGEDGVWQDIPGSPSTEPRPLFRPPESKVEYFFRMRMGGEGKWSIWVESQSVYWDLAALARPVASASVTGLAAVTVSWEGVADATGYLVERRPMIEGSGEWELVEETDFGKTSVVDNAVEPGGTYSYRVTALAEQEVTSEPSEEVAVTVPALPTVPTPTPVPPRPDRQVPTISLVEGSYLVTARRSVVLHAKASDNRGVTGVEFSVGDEKRVRQAKASGGTWEIRLALPQRLTYVRARALDKAGNRSEPFQTVIFRTGR